ncbi:MAG TPA: CocE/NonD family hydrolase [Kribbella sp.]|uniref:CocE/NonD family hydrolase n=1 Tax=Kribbella sp. TaxID=1871183 RepID=UPI002D7A02E0|nr:CocE/NonD family hydrolase [Kribbella sp.]HET6298468.1 CocE/NonD family hydrolase [Kribbella sp.]
MTNSMIYERDVQIPVRDGEPLSANVYRPVEEGTYPVIVTLGPYGKDRHWADRDQQHSRDLGGGPFVNWETPNPETWVPKGYVVVRVDGRGTGASPGILAPFSDTAAENYYDAIEWAGVQPWSAGKVGLLGISFYAMTQWPVAALRPPHLAAIVPWEGAADMYRDFTRAGGILNSRFLSWWWPNTVLNVQNGWDGSLTQAERDANTVTSLNDACLARPLDGDYVGEWRPDLSQINVPVLSVGNWGNIGLHLRGNIEAYLQASSAQKWLRIVIGDHIHPFYEPENIELQERFLGHFLKGEETGWTNEPPVVLAIRDGDEITWRGEQEWPIARTQWTTYHLNAAAGSLSTDAPASDDEGRYAALTETLTFTTSPFTATTEVTGPVTLRLWIDSSTTDADIFVRLGRRNADGTEMLAVGPTLDDVSLTQGWLRASHRKLDDKRSQPHRPFHAHDEIESLEPGVAVPLDVEIWATSVVFPEGSSLFLEVSGHELEYSYFVHDDPVDRPSEIFDNEVTVHTGPARSSYLVLPVIPR